MEPDLLGAGRYEYTDEDEPAVVCRTGRECQGEGWDGEECVFAGGVDAGDGHGGGRV